MFRVQRTGRLRGGGDRMATIRHRSRALGREREVGGKKELLWQLE